jgi:hypothetical protein
MRVKAHALVYWLITPQNHLQSDPKPCTPGVIGFRLAAVLR